MMAPLYVKQQTILSLEDMRSLYITTLSILLATLLGGNAARAQVALTDTNHTVNISAVSHLKVPGHISNMSIVNHRLYFYNSEVLFSAPITEQGIGNTDIDQTMAALDPEMDYVVQYDENTLYYTKKTNKGMSTLYRIELDKKKGKPVIERVKMGKFPSSVIHPTFSNDGKVMVFSSNDLVGFGGYDLWYSLKTDDDWSYPYNMGRRINTSGNEMAPHIVGEYLFFSTNKDFTSTGSDIYATKLIASNTIFGDTIVPFPIGRCEVQRFPYPISSTVEDKELVVAPSDGLFFVASNRLSDKNDNLFVGHGPLDAIMMEGDVESSTDGEKLSSVSIQVALSREPNNILFTQTNGQQGHYRIHLQPNEAYTITFASPNYLSNTIEITTELDNTDRLIKQLSYPIVLLTFTNDRNYLYEATNLFGSTVGTELTQQGKLTLESIARFLKENPNRKVEITSIYCKHDNIRFNQLICNNRMEEIMNYLMQNMVDEKNIILTDPYTHPFYNEETSTHTNSILLRFR